MKQIDGVDAAQEAVVGVLVCALPLLLLPPAADPFEVPKLSFAVLGAAALVLLSVFGGTRARELTGLSYALVAFGASATLSTLFSMHWPTSLWGGHDSHAGLAYVFALIAIAMCSRGLQQFGLWEQCLVISTALTALYGVVQWMGADPISWSRTAQWCGALRPFSTLGHPNSLAAFLAMSAPLVLSTSVEALRRAKRVQGGFGILVVLVSAAVALPTYSRAGWIAFAVGLVVLFVLLPKSVIRIRARWIFLAFGIAVIVASQSVAFRTRVFGLFSSPTRLAMYRAAVEIFLDQPLVGSGLDTFQLAFQAHRTPEYWAHEWGATPQRAHNDFLQVLATQGVFGAVALVACCWFVLRALRRARHHSDPITRTYIAGLAGCLAAAAVYALFSFHVTATALLAAIALGQLDHLSSHSAFGNGTTTRGNRAASRRAFRMAALTALAAVVVFTFAVMPLVANIFVRRGIELEAHEPLQAQAAYESALRWMPFADTTWTRLGVILRRIEMTHSTQPGSTTSQAARALSRAIELSPQNAYHHANWGRFLGRMEGASADASNQAFDRALNLDPYNALIFVDAIEAAMRHQEIDRAQTLAERLVAKYPRYGVAWLWLGLIARAADRLDEAEAFFSNAAHGEWPNDPQGLSKSRAQLEAFLRERGVAPRMDDSQTSASPVVPVSPGCE